MREDVLASRRRERRRFGRFTNSLGWLYQELGDFKRAVEYDREGADLGRRYKIPNVEVSSLINVGFDYLKLGEPAKALNLFEDTLSRAEKGFGAHRWRWVMRLSVCIAEALLETAQPEKALVFLDKGLAQARPTGSMKYIAKCHALRGEIALGASQWSQAEADLDEALRIARQIGYPTLTWHAAHLLAQAHAGQNKMEDAFAAASLAVETINSVAARIPAPDLRQTFLAWPRVQAIQEDLARLRRA